MNDDSDKPRIPLVYHGVHIGDLVERDEGYGHLFYPREALAPFSRNLLLHVARIMLALEESDAGIEEFKNRE